MAFGASGSPVLMYHKVGQTITCPADGFINIIPDAFRRQMRLMRALGYRALPFGEVIEAHASGKPPQARTFVITFDDAYRCVSDAAAPILKELGMRATVFAVTDCVGSTNRWDQDTEYPKADLMDWEQLRELAGAGWEIGGHTRTHPHLDFLDDEAARSEIAGCKAELEARLSVPIRTFCYPYGGANARTPILVRESGYTGACTMCSGLAHPRFSPYMQPRVKVYQNGVTELLWRFLVRPHLPDWRRRAALARNVR